MAAMYSLPPYMPADFNPIPTDVMYDLPNYHKLSSEASKNATTNGELTIVDPVKLVEKKQLDLIASLNSLGNKLNDLLKQKGNIKSVTNDKAGKPVQAKKEAEPVKNEADGAKKDKDAKKEARKAAKQEAKAKVASGTSQEEATGKGKTPKGNNIPWVVKEEKRSTETGQSLTACTKPELADFAKEDLGDVKLTALNDDLPWLKALAQLGERRGVVFTGKVTNKAKGKSSVLVEIGDKFALSFKEGSIGSRVATWEVLGSALGLYSFDTTQSIQATHQRLWLSQAEKIIRKEADLCAITREISQFLSNFDTLGSQFNIGVADIVFRSLMNSSAQPSNVELWIGRIDSV